MAAMASDVPREAALADMAGPEQPKREYDFVEEPPESLCCPICCEVSEELHLISCCGHHLCRACVERIHRDKKPCPLCQNEKFTSLLDKGRQRTVRLLQVRCTNRNAGCEWKGELGKLDDHLYPKLEENQYSVEQKRGCRFELMECRSGCHGKFERRLLHEHEIYECPHRPFCCEYCEDYGATFLEVEAHWEDCECYPIPCPNHCDAGKVKRKNLQEHIRGVCPLEAVRCEYSPVGCPFEGLRRDIQAHLEDQQHHHNSLLLRQNLELQRRLEMKEVEAAAATELTTIMAEQLQTLASDVQHIRGRLEDKDAEMVARAAENEALRKVIDQMKGRMDHERDALSKGSEKVEERVNLLEGEIAALKHKGKQRETLFVAETKEIKRAMTAETNRLLRLQEERYQRDIEEVRQNQREDREKLGLEIAAVGKTAGDGIQAVGDKSTHIEKEIARLKQEHEQMSKEATARLQLLGQVMEGHNGMDQAQNVLSAQLNQLEAQARQENQTVEAQLQDVQHQLQEFGATKAQTRSLGNEVEQLKQKQRGHELLLRDTQQLKETIAYVKRCITPRPPFHFTVSRYSLRKKHNNPFVSNPFYTGLRGYKVCIRVDISPADIVSVYGCLQRGEHDDILRWPFRGRIHVRLQNQDADYNHVHGAITYDANTEDKFAARVELGDKNYIKLWNRGSNFNAVRVPGYVAGDAIDFVVTRVDVDQGPRLSCW